MNINDENSCVTSYPHELIEGNCDGRRKKGNRRSSILKMTKSPMRGPALDDIDPNTQSSDEIVEMSKKLRRSASRRVSFAETCQIKEIPNEVKKRSWAWEEPYKNDENASASIPEVNGNTCGDSSYKQPASTLAGLSSLLSSPIQDSPEKERYRQADGRSSDFCNKVTFLDFTQCVDVDPRTNVSVDEMDMTLNNTARILVQEGPPHTRDAQTSFYQTETQQNQGLQEPKITSVYYDQTEHYYTEKTASLEFTRCYGGAVADDRESTTCNQMEITMNQTAAAATNVLQHAPPQHTAANVLQHAPPQHSTANVDSSVKVDASSFLRQLGAKNTIAERPSSLDFTRCYGENAVGEDFTSDEMEFTANHGDGVMYGENSGHVRSNTSTKRSSNAPRQALQVILKDKNEVSTKMNAGYNLQYKAGNEEERPCDLRSAARSDDMGGTKVDGSAFLRKLGDNMIHEASTTEINDGCYSMRKARDEENAWQTPSATRPVSFSRADGDNAKVDGSAFLRKLGGGPIGREDTVAFDQTLVNDDRDMDMTRCLSKSVAQGWSESKVDHQIRKDEDYEDMDTTRCLPKSKTPCLPKDEAFDQTLVNDDRDMDMTRCLSKSKAPCLPKDEAFEQTLVNDDPDMDMTRCLSKSVAQGWSENKVDHQIRNYEDYEDMDTTRCLPKSKTPCLPKDEAFDQTLVNDDRDMDMTRCLSKRVAQGWNESYVNHQIRKDEDHVDMETTRCLPKSKTPCLPKGEAFDQTLVNDDRDMDMTRCLPKSKTPCLPKGEAFDQTLVNDDQDMDMTRCLSKEQGRNDSEPASRIAIGADRQDMEMTRCLPNTGRNRSNGPRVAEDDGLCADMDMTRCLSKAQEKNENQVAPQVDEDSEDMETTKCLPKSGLQSTMNESDVGSQIAADMDMTRCLPEVQGKNERKFGPRIVEDEDSEDMETTKCLSKSGLQSIMNESNVGPHVAADMDMTRCLPEVQRNDDSKFGPQVVEDEDSHTMDMTGCLAKGKRQARNSLCKVGALTFEDNDSPDMEMTCRQPVQTASESETASDCFDDTLPVTGDEMGLAKCGVETKLKRRDSARSEVIGQTKDIQVDASFKRINLDTEGTTAIDKSFVSVATSTNEPVRLHEWNIDLSRFSKAYVEAGTHDDDAVNRATPNVIALVAGGDDSKSSDALKERPHADPNLLKQGNVERKARLNLSVNEGTKVKRRAMDDGQTKDPALDSGKVDIVPRLSKTLPLKNSAARVVPKKGIKASVDANSTWTGPGTHEVVHVGRSIFAAKGPAIGPKHSLLNRRANARAAEASDAKPVVFVPCKVVNVDSLIEKSKECETLVGSSIERLDAPGDGQLKSPCKESGVVPGVRGGLSDESVCTTPVPMMNKSLFGSVCGDSLIMDEKIPDEISEMEAETEGGNIVFDAEDREDNLGRKGPATPNVFDLVRSRTRPTTNRNLSVISEEGSCYQTIKNDDDAEGKTEECEKGRKLPNDDSSNSEQSYTLQEFLSSANVTFIKHVTRRSECPLQASDPCTEMKDIIVRESVAEAKFPVWDNVTKQLQAVITENERLSSVKEQELNKSNPTVFGVLKQSLAMDTTNSDVIEKIMALKRACRHSALEYWYGWRIEMDEQVLGLLKEQEKNVSDDLSLLDNHENDLDGDICLLDQMTVDFDEKIHDLEITLESEEKSWDECKEEMEVSKKQLEELELELQSQEKQREQLASENGTISRQITDKKNKKTKLESSIQSLEELTHAASNLEETMAEEKLMRNALEWELEEHDATSMKFIFLYRTFELDISFEDSDVDSSLPARIKHVNLVSCIAEDSSPLAHFCHQLIVEKFSQCDFMQTFPSRDKLPELLHIVSGAMAKVRMLLEDVDIISINHIVSFHDKLFTVDFSSLKNFIKFVITFDLSNIVEDGTLPRAVVKKIGTISSDVIAKKLNDIPSTILCLSKVFKAADEFLS